MIDEPPSGDLAPGQPTPQESSEWVPGPNLPPSPTTFDYSAPSGSTVVAGLQLAGFWTRFLGFLVDGVIFYVVNSILAAIFEPTATTVVGGVSITTRTGPTGLVDVILLLLELGYFSWFWTNRGASLGQMLVGIRVVDSESGAGLKGSQAAVRYLGYILSGIPLLLGFIWAGFDPKKQGWMDKLAGTQVVRSR
ncbi:MAG: RDD family protein [Candidatus Dormibacteria bacterium]